MIKIYRKLTQDQKSRGVIFSSTLVYNKRDNEQGSRTHEVTTYSPPSEQERQIKLLKNDSFFDRSQWKYNIIRN